MINFLHTNIPQSIFLLIGPFTIYYYGLLIVLGIILGLFLSIRLASYYEIEKETIIDSAFYLVILGLLGGRLYHVCLEFPYYSEHPLQIFMIWRGGLAIHGGIIAGIFTTYFFARKNKLNPIVLASIYAPALALAQAIGRWGNYFNQELYGMPTKAAWSIPIAMGKRVSGYTEFGYFHPTFLYESLGNFLIFITLISAHYYFLKNKKSNFNYAIVLLYLALYSVLRFSLEFIRIDPTPVYFGLKVPQIASLAIILLCILFLIFKKIRTKLV